LDQSCARKINSEQNDALQTEYDDNFVKHMIVVADPAQAPEDFTGSVFSSEEEKADALDKMMNDVDQAVRSVLSLDRFSKVKQSRSRGLKPGMQRIRLKRNRSSPKTEFEPYKVCFGNVNPNRSLLAASLALRVCVFAPKSSS